MDNKKAKPKSEKDGRIFLGVYFPSAMVPLIDHAVSLSDSDRSKFLRAAVREKLARQKLDKLQPAS